MQPLKPYQVISQQFQISIESAKYFLGRVQKSFKKEKPSQALILTFMQERHFEILPKPYELAKQMYDAGVWAFPMNSAPLVLEDEEDIYR